MTIEVIDNNESGASVRSKINSNFSELDAMRQFLLPHVSQQPVSPEVIAGEEVSISVTAASAQGTSLITTYKRQEFVGGVWQDTGEVNSFAKSEADESDEGRKFRWIVQNQVGDVVSDEAEIVFRKPHDGVIYALFTGQSNEQGRDNSDRSVLSHPNVFVFNDATKQIEHWNLDSTPPQNQTYAAVGNNAISGNDCMTMYTAAKLADETGKKIVCIVAARGGTNLQEWLPDGLVLENLQTQLESPLIPRIDVHFHHHGENHRSTAASVLLGLLRTFRSTMKSLPKYWDECPLIMGEVLRLPHLATVNEALNLFKDEAEDVYLATSEGTSYITEGVILHFDSASLKIMGHRRTALAVPLLPHIYAGSSGMRPTGISGATYEATENTINLIWNDSADSSVVAYEIQKKVNDVWVHQVTLSPGAEEWLDEGLEVSTVYYYRIGAVNRYGTRWTSMSALTWDPPGIVEQPQDTEVFDGADAEFAIEFNRESATYQWYLYADEDDTVGEEIDGETNATCTLSSLEHADEGKQVACVVSYNGDTFTSERATLSIWDITKVPDVQLWFDPRDTSLLFSDRGGASATTPATDGGVVGTIKSKVGAIFAVPSSDANRATYDADGINGTPCLTFTGSQAYLLDASTKSLDRHASYFYHFAVYAAATGTRNLHLSVAAGKNRMVFGASTATLLLQARQQDDAASAYNCNKTNTIVDNVAAVLTGVYARGRMAVRHNGTEVAALIVPDSPTADTDNTSISFGPSVGKVGHRVIVKSATPLDAAIVRKIEDYLAFQSGITFTS